MLVPVIDLMALTFHVGILNISNAFQQMLVPAAPIPCLLNRCIMDLRVETSKA